MIAPADFNMPKPSRDGGNSLEVAVTSAGLVTPPHSPEIGSAIAWDNQYDQVALFPAAAKGWLVDVGVFDYDTVVFRDLRARRGRAVFQGYLRYYMSDHRPMWVRVRPE